MSELHYRERAAAGNAAGLLVLHHGRGTDEHDLAGLAEVLDPRRRLHAVMPRGPLTLQGMQGRHWYAVLHVGHPDPATFAGAYRQLAELHDQLWRATGIGSDQTVLGGFSMGAVMSYALGLGADRPAPAGVLAFSGFIPTVAGWQPSTADRHGVRVFIAHGRRDPVIDVGFAHRARALLEGAGLDVDYHESNAGHQIDPAHIPLARAWIERTLGLDAPAADA